MADHPSHSGRDGDAAVPDAGGDASPLVGDVLTELQEMLANAGAPAEVMQAVAGLDPNGDPDEMVDRLIEIGVLPSHEDAAKAMIKGWEPLLEPGCDPFEAELAGGEFLGMISEDVNDEDAMPEVFATMVRDAEADAMPAALAMLRVLAVLGPPSIRPEASAAADRLVSAGLEDRPWVKELGRPTIGKCFGYTDAFGSQTAITVTSKYGRKRHGLNVLIDHELGGGVKDCWATDRPDRIRAAYRETTEQHGLDLWDYEQAHAREILEKALAQTPCPVEPDQIEDVRDHLPLLRLRVELLGKPTKPTKPTTKTAAAQSPPANVRRDARKSLIRSVNTQSTEAWRAR
jgi:hypothetical protein